MPLSPVSRIERYQGLAPQAHLRQHDADLDLLEVGQDDFKQTLDTIKARLNGVLASLVVAALLLAANLVIGK